MAHHPLGRLDSYLEGRLSPRAHARVAEHVRRCPMCADAVRERAQVLAAASQRAATPQGNRPPSSAASRPVATPDRAAGVDASGAGSHAHGVGVRHGALSGGRRSGRAVALGLGAVALASLAVGGLWSAGAPAASDPATLRESARSVSAAAQREDGSVDDRIASLRQAGWSVPSLYTAGLVPSGLETRSAADVVELDVRWNGAAGQVRVRECRREPDAAPASGTGAAEADAPPRQCPSGVDRGDSAAVPEPDRTIVARAVDGGRRLDYRMLSEQGPQSEPWTVSFETAGARYVVTSDLPREKIRPLLGLLAAADRARVDRAEAQEGVDERLRRGLERLGDVAALDARVTAGASAPHGR